MRPNEFFGSKSPERTPTPGKSLATAWRALERSASVLFHHSWNPIRHTGAIATSLIAILIVTGVALLFVYRLGAPHASLAEATASAGLNWLRTVHRYATELTLIVIVLHAVRMFIEGRTWGPRTLAWISGVVLLGMFLFSSYTGFMLVWDRFGLKIARMGAEIFDLLPFLPTAISRNFSGDIALGGSFFFLNLFLHVAIPLLMGAALGIHLSRVRKPTWILSWRGIAVLAGGLLAWALLAPLDLDLAADPLALRTAAVQSFAFSLWPFLQERLGPEWTVMIFVLLVVLAVSAPWWWRPRAEVTPVKSAVDEEHCEGCRQCFEDCPFGAIEMRPRTVSAGVPGKSEWVAHVLNDLCVGCGICSGSCNQFSVGPAPWNGRRQLLAVLKPSRPEIRSAFVTCAHRQPDLDLPESTVWSRVDCVGVLHSATFMRMLQYYERVAIWGCETGECGARLGGETLQARLFEGQNPSLAARADRSRLLWIESDVNLSANRSVMHAFLEKGTRPRTGELRARPSRLATVAAAGLMGGLLLLISTASSSRLGAPATESGLRVTWRQNPERVRACRTLTPEELASRPMHMRTPQECSEALRSYVLRVLVDGQERIHRTLRPKGARADRPVSILENVALSSGQHRIHVALVPEEGESSGVQGEFDLTFPRGRLRLITLKDGRLVSDTETK